MSKILRDQNPGLARRFAVDYALRFEDLSDHDLMTVFSSLCRQEQLRVPLETLLHAVRKLSKMKRLPNFGNAGAVRTLFADAKKRMTVRLREAARDGNKLPRELTVDDVDASAALTRDPLRVLEEELQGRGFGVVEKELRELGARVRVRQAEGRPLDGLVGNYVFTGKPGTGKVRFFNFYLLVSFFLS